MISRFVFQRYRFLPYGQTEKTILSFRKDRTSEIFLPDALIYRRKREQNGAESQKNSNFVRQNDMQMEISRQREHARDVLTQYLLQYKLRRTVERYAVLDAVFELEGPFDVEQLLQHLVNVGRFRVCKATLYNTLSLLCKARLVLCHPQVGDRMLFESSCSGETKVYTLCDVCGKLTPINGTSITEQMGKVKTPRFHAEKSVLYLHGVCSRCTSAQKRKMKNLKSK